METQDNWPPFPMMGAKDAADRHGFHAEQVYRAIRRSLGTKHPIGYQSGGTWLIYTQAARNLHGELDPLEEGRPKKAKKEKK